MSRILLSNILNCVKYTSGNTWKSHNRWVFKTKSDNARHIWRRWCHVVLASVGVGSGVTACWLVYSRSTLHLSAAACEVPPSSAALHQVHQHHTDVENQFDWYQLWLLVRPYLHILTAAAFCAVVVAVCNVQIPQLLGNLVNSLSQLLTSTAVGARANINSDTLTPVALRLISIYLCQAVATFSYITCLAYVGEGIASDLRSNLFSTLILQNVEFFDRHRTGELVNRITTDVQDFKSSFKLCISQGLRTITQVAGCAGALYQISPQLTLATLCLTCAMVMAGAATGRLLRVLSRQAQQQTANATAVAEEALASIRTVRSFSMEQVESENFQAEVDKSRRLHIRLGVGVGVFQAGYSVFINTAILSVLYWGGGLVQTGDISAGQLMAFLVTSQTVQRSLSQLSVLFGTYVRGVSAGCRVFEYLKLPLGTDLHCGDIIPEDQLSGSVEFRRVHFHYPTRAQLPVLHGLQLRLAAGHVTAVVGVSGSGKSTCAALLERFYDPSEGSVLVDGRDVRELNAGWLRGRLVGLISQEPVLFATTIRDNIRYGNLEASDQQIEEAARISDAHSFISRLPDGYSTVLGERGVSLSGGQKQRIAIARALVKNPKIIILDEATSALDVESERAVQKALDRAVAGRTVLVIAHRLSTVRHAHCIAVLNNGVVAEMGTHDELVKRRGLYWDLVKHNALRDT